MESRRVCGPMIAGCNHFDEDKIRIRIKVKSRILIRSKVMRIRNPDGMLTFLKNSPSAK
jgi:hypothetical protein